MIYKFIAKVVLGKDDKKRWYIVVNDQDSETIGETVVCGMPMQAKDAPVGTIFETTLTIPE